jgi:hypothetical protein
MYLEFLPHWLFSSEILRTLEATFRYILFAVAAESQQLATYLSTKVSNNLLQKRESWSN